MPDDTRQVRDLSGNVTVLDVSGDVTCNFEVSADTLDRRGTLRRGATLYRSLRIGGDDARAIDEESRTVELAFSSEEPYERFFGVEVLDHKAASVRMSRLQDGAALLLQHDTDQQIGVVESARIDGDRRGRAKVRFGRGQLAEEIFRDVLDGIRRHVSVGYIVHDMQLEARGEDVDTYRVTDWEPLEVSIVSIPADASVGVGRSGPSVRHSARQQQEAADMPADTEHMLDDEQHDEAGAGTMLDADDNGREAGDEIQTRDVEREEIDRQIRHLGKRFRAPELAEQMVDLESSVEDMRAALRERVKKAPVPVPAARDERVEMPRYRAKALRAFAAQGEEAAYRAGMWALATIHGNPRATRWCKDYGVPLHMSTRVASSGSIAGGGAIVPEPLADAIIDLREQYGAIRRVARIWSMSSDTEYVPRRAGGVTAYFVGQADATTESDKSWDQVQLVSKELSALSRVPMSYAEDAVIDVAEDLAREMAYAFAEKEDDCAINGDGTSTYGGIQGMRSKLVATASLTGAVDATSGTDTIPEVDGDDLDLVRATLPAYADQGAKWLVHKAFKNRVHDSISRAAGGNTIETIGGRPMAAYLGDEIVVSQKMPGGLATNYNNVVMALYGNFELGAILGDRRGFEVQVLRERYAEYRQIGIIGWERFDFVCHDVGTTSAAGPIVGLVGQT